MNCFLEGACNLLRRKWDGATPGTRMQTAISSFIFNGSERHDSLEILRNFATGDEARELADILRRHLEPRWTDPDHAIRERLTIEILNRLRSERLLLECHNNRKMLDLLNYHLKACTFVDVVCTQQLFLARRIQHWLNTIVKDFEHMAPELPYMFELQKRYNAAWHEIDSRATRPAASTTVIVHPNRTPPPNRLQRNSDIERLDLQREKASPEEVNALRARPSESNILCFDILRMMLHPDENESIIRYSLARATALKLQLVQTTNLQVQTRETHGETAFKGDVIDTVLRLDYCIAVVNACELPQNNSQREHFEKGPEDVAPPRYQYRI